ncbi:DUF1353 domain-containing protein [Brevundimonas sp. NPDC092305]|uniref:DUF1353 domain-containing protein n=1 Tax=Brevundimonas sp. NPDC092305 TaxID=3363957 RepID=UPI0038293F62
MTRLLTLASMALLVLLTGCSPHYVSAAMEVGEPGLVQILLRDQRIGGNRASVLAADLLYCYPPTGEVIIVPAGYVTDFASVPDGLGRVLEQYGDSIEAAIVHDWLYAVGEPGRKAWADDLFRYALAEQGVTATDRWTKWIGVTVGGGRSYGNASEWDERFWSKDGAGPVSPPFAKPRSAVVARVNRCNEITARREARTFIDKHGSHTWPRA